MYRLIIADDEKIVCRALEHKIQNYVEGIELLPSVHDGVDLIKSVEKYHPDIAIVDINMPGLGGLEAIEMLRMKKIETKVVIHTAYSEFEYAKKALKLGASDYLLKPGTKEGIIETIGKICRELDQERMEEQKTQRNQAAANNLQELMEGKWMQSLLLGEMDKECYQKICGYYRDMSYGGVFTSWKIAFCQEQEEDRKANDEERKKIEEAEKKIIDSMREICHCIGIFYKGVVYLFLIPGKDLEEEKIYENWTLETVNFVRRKLEKDEIYTVVGVSRLKKEQETFVKGIYEAKMVLQGRNQQGVIFFQKSEREKIEIFLEGQAEKTAAMLFERNTEKALRDIKCKIEREDEKAISKDKLDEKKVGALSYLFDLEKKIRILGDRSKEAERMTDIWTAFRDIDTTQKLSLWLEREICDMDQYYFQKKTSSYLSEKTEESQDRKERSDVENTIDKTDAEFGLYKREKENPYIKKALLCLQESYATDLSLDDLAGKVGISSFYLSRLFKQEQNVTFLELLTNLRMKKAVQMMREGEKTIREISIGVGYANMTYFYKVFKKTTGFTVGDMRKYF